MTAKLHVCRPRSARPPAAGAFRGPAHGALRRCPAGPSSAASRRRAQLREVPREHVVRLPHVRARRGREAAPGAAERASTASAP